jgi:hypothetical protein
LTGGLLSGRAFVHFPLPPYDSNNADVSFKIDENGQLVMWKKKWSKDKLFHHISCIFIPKSIY